MIVTRRQIAKGAAWTLPAVAIGMAAPAASASTDPRPVISVEELCKVDAKSRHDKQVFLTLWVGQPTFLVSVTVAGITVPVGKLLTTGQQYPVSVTVASGKLSGSNTPVSVVYAVNGGTHYTEDLTHGAIPDCKAHGS